jgi:hypothetical protein
VNTHGNGPDSEPVSGTVPVSAPVSSLTNGSWAAGELTTADQADWYTITAGSTADLYLQWEDRHNSSYTSQVRVWVYYGGSLHIAWSGISFPSFNMGDTLYVKVAPYDKSGDNTGTYRIRYTQ